MARGRAPNLSLPPTRALTQQRDYRARKAARIAYLEKTNKELGDEVENLRRELVEVKQGKGRDGDVEKVRSRRTRLCFSKVIAFELSLPRHGVFCFVLFFLSSFSLSYRLSL